VSANATEDGMARIVAQVRPEEAALFEKALQVALRKAFAGSAGGSESGSAEPVGSAAGSEGGSAEPDRFGRADALVAITNTFLGLANEPARTPGRFEVQVRVDADVLRGERCGYGPDALCELDDCTPLEPEAARRIAWRRCAGSLHRGRGRDSPGHGAPAAHDRSLFGASALEARRRLRVAGVWLRPLPPGASPRALGGRRRDEAREPRVGLQPASPRGAALRLLPSKAA
jgi:hypothetical protein